MQTTLRVIEAVPNGHLDYRPDSKSKTALGLVRHITLEDEWLLNCIANGEFTPPPDDSDACGIMNPADAVARYKEKVPAALDRVRAMSGDKLTNVIDLFGMIQAPASQLSGDDRPSIRSTTAASSAPTCARWAARSRGSTGLPPTLSSDRRREFSGGEACLWTGHVSPHNLDLRLYTDPCPAPK